MKNFFDVKNVTFSSSSDHKLIDVTFNIKNPGDIFLFLDHLEWVKPQFSEPLQD